MRAILRVGSRGDDVKKLQTELNSQLNPSPNLTPDGVYGPKTATAVKRFQKEAWLVEDGSAGQATWNAVMGLETYEPILWPITLIPQADTTLCWAASTAMVTRTTQRAVVERTPNALLTDNGSLDNDSSGPLGATSYIAQFAVANSMRVLPPQSYPPLAFRTLMQFGPVVFNLLWDAATFAANQGSNGHMIAVVGVRGDNDASGDGTTLRVFDPWPPQVGRIYSRGYHQWIREVPALTYSIFQP